MPTYNVEIQMKVRKTYEVEADNEDEAIDLAHQMATPRYEDGIDEYYDEETMSCHLKEDA